MANIVTVTDMRRRFGHFLRLVEAGEDIVIMRRGKIIARLFRDPEFRAAR